MVTFLAPLASNFEGLKDRYLLGHTLMACVHTGNQTNQTSFCHFTLFKISDFDELVLGHLRYGLTDVLPQPSPLPDNVITPDRLADDARQYEGGSKW